MAPWPPAFSAAFIEQARALLDIRPVLVIIGPVGGHRNRLAADIAELPEGPAWCRHVARYGETTVPYFAVRQLFHGLRPASDAPLDTVEAAVRTALETLDEERPTIVLANTDLCDAESIEVLVRVAETHDIRLIATLTPETICDQHLLLGSAEVIEIPPLDGDTISDLLRARFGAAPHPSLVDLLVERTGGSYAVVRDVADVSFGSGLIIAVENVLVPRPEPSTGTTDRLASLLTPQAAARLGGGTEITDLVHLTSLLGELDLEEARACLPSGIVDLATTHGTFAVVDGGLVFAARSERMLVLRTLSHERQLELFEKFARNIPLTLRRAGVAAQAADWWRAAGRLLPVELATQAAREANLTGRHRRAIVYTDPDNNEKHEDIAPIERIFALTELGDSFDLAAMLAAVDPMDLSEDELLPYLRWAGRLPPEAGAECLVRQALETPDPAARRRRASVLNLATLVDQVFDTSGDELANRLRALAFSAQLSVGNRAMTFAALSAALRQSGRPVQAVEAAEFALRILTTEPDTVSATHLAPVRELHVSALLTAVDLGGAQRALREYSSGPFTQTGSGRVASSLQAALAFFRGDAQQALAGARLCLAGLRRHDSHEIRGPVEAMLSLILARCERPGEARELLESSKLHAPRHRQSDLERRIHQACTHDALAEPEEALQLLAEVVDEAREHGLTLALIGAAALSVQIGGPPHLTELLEAVGELDDPSGTPLIWQTFARAANDDDLTALVDLAEQLDVLEARLFSAEVAQYVLDLGRRSADLDPATRSRLEHLADPMPRRTDLRTG